MLSEINFYFKYMNKFLSLKFKNKKQAVFSLLIMWLICFLVSTIFASLRYNMPFLSIFTKHFIDLLPMIVTLSVGLTEFIGVIVPPLKYTGEEATYFIFVIALVFAHVLIIKKRSVLLYVLLFILLLLLSYSWAYTALGIRWV